MGLREAKAGFGKGRGAEVPGLEEGAIAGGVEGLAGIALPDRASAAVQRIHPGRSTTQGDLAAGGVARGREGTDQILFLRSAGELHTAPPGAYHQVPVEDRARLPSAQGRTWIGPLRGEKLEWLAPSRHASDACLLLPHPRNPAQQKKLLGGPCRRRGVKSSICSLRGPETAPTAERSQATRR